MNARTLTAVLGLICIWGTLIALADDPPLFSGPQVGETLAPLRVLVPCGELGGKQMDFAEVAKGKPTVLVVVNGANRLAATLTRILMHYVEMRSKDELFGGVVWLGPDRSTSEQLLIRTHGAWGIGAPLGISLDGSEGPGSYGFNRNVNLTVIVANRNRVTANFAVIQPGVSDASKILQQIVKQAGGTVPTRSEIEYLRLMSLPERNLPFPWENSARQTELRRRFCALLAAADDAQADAAAEKVDAYVRDNADIRDQFQHAVRLLVPSDSNATYRTFVTPHATRHVRRWHEQLGDADKSK